MTDVLNDRQQRFVAAYVVLGNATEAYIQAGYAAKDRTIAGVNASRLLQHPAIQRAIQQSQDYSRERVALPLPDPLPEALDTPNEETVEVEYQVSKGRKKLVRTEPQIIDVPMEALENGVVDFSWLLQNLVSVYQKCIQAVPVTSLKGVKVGVYKFDSVGANRALELIGKLTGIMIDRKANLHANLTGAGGADLSALSDHQLAQLEAILGPIKEGK